jgi:hypothetical protein
LTIASPQQRLQKKRHGLRPEVRRNITDLQPSPHLAVIGIGGWPRYLPGMSFVPFSVRGEKAIGRRFVIAVQAK